ncbi:MAG TPA: J domain-containing protein [Amnibacterium sp.]
MTRIEAAALLGVAADATGPGVQKAFLRLARRVHPDVLPTATEAQRREAAERFDAIVRARGVLLDPASASTVGPPASDWSPRAGEPTGPRYRTVPGRGLGNSLVVLALLAFLLVALVTIDHALRTHAFDSPGGGATQVATATP